jgi:hypothetical protein
MYQTPIQITSSLNPLIPTGNMFLHAKEAAFISAFHRDCIYKKRVKNGRVTNHHEERKNSIHFLSIYPYYSLSLPVILDVSSSTSAINSFLFSC